MKYEVDLRLTVDISVEVFAKSSEEAVQKAKESEVARLSVADQARDLFADEFEFVGVRDVTRKGEEDENE